MLITTDEIAQAKGNALSTIAGISIESAIRDLYSMKNSVCTPLHTQKMYCMYLYLFALETWCLDEDEIQWLTHDQMVALVAKLEDMQGEYAGFALIDSSSVTVGGSGDTGTGGNTGGGTGSVSGSVLYTGVGGEATFTLPVLAGKTIIAVLKDGIGREFSQGTDVTFVPLEDEFYILSTGQVKYNPGINNNQKVRILYS